MCAMRLGVRLVDVNVCKRVFLVKHLAGGSVLHTFFKIPRARVGF